MLLLTPFEHYAFESMLTVYVISTADRLNVRWKRHQTIFWAKRLNFLSLLKLQRRISPKLFGQMDSKGVKTTIGSWISIFWKSFLEVWNFNSHWRIWPTTVPLLLKSEPIEINQNLKFMLQGIDVWKILKVPRTFKST